MMVDLSVETLRALLGRPAYDDSVRAVIGDPSAIVRAAPYGYVEFKQGGVAVMFKEAPVANVGAEGASSELRVAAIHFHGEGHEGYARYRGLLPGGLSIGDAKVNVVRKLGVPAAAGGGNYSSVLGITVPQWIRHDVDGALLQWTLDSRERVVMASLFLPPAP